MSEADDELRASLVRMLEQAIAVIRRAPEDRLHGAVANMIATFRASLGETSLETIDVLMAQQSQDVQDLYQAFRDAERAYQKAAPRASLFGELCGLPS